MAARRSDRIRTNRAIGIASSTPGRGRDRLSDLPDFLLGHVLSFLPTKEAGRTAELSRRWRHVFCNVDTISFEEKEGDRAKDWDTFYFEAEEKKSCSGALLDDVSSALLCRRRCAGGQNVPLRRLRFAFDKAHLWDFDHVNQWLTYVLRHGNQELHLDLRFRLSPIWCDHRQKVEVDSGTDNSDHEDRCDKTKMMWVYVLPRRLFTCRVIRTLCIAHCRMKLPAAVNLPLLETLSITAPHSDGGRSIQRLISSCPRLADLTLESIPRLKRVSVLDKRLRRFALRCCHNMKSADIDASELRSLEYCGTVPAESLLSLHGSRGVTSCTVNFCKALCEDAEFARFRGFMEKISDAKYLHLHHRSLESMIFFGFPSFTSLTRLALQGPLKSCATVVAVGRMLEQTPNLEVLSLYMEDSVVKKFMAPDESSFSTPCLRHRVKEINMVHYVGDKIQRMMARLLLRNALVLERVCVCLVKGTIEFQSDLKNKIDGWVVANAQKVYL